MSACADVRCNSIPVDGGDPLVTVPQISTIRKRCYNAHIDGDNRECDRSVRSDWVVKPTVLVAHAIRFNQEGDKVHPVGRDMMAPPVLHLQGSTYGLCIVAEHVGDSATSGHYVAYARDIGFAGRFRFDDGDVSSCSEDDATRHPYIVMCQKLDKSGCKFCISPLRGWYRDAT